MQNVNSYPKCFFCIKHILPCIFNRAFSTPDTFHTSEKAELNKSNLWVKPVDSIVVNISQVLVVLVSMSFYAH